MSTRVVSADTSSPVRKGVWSTWTRFWFAPSHPLSLHAIRILFGILLLCWLLPFAGYIHDFFGLDGWFDRAAYAEASQGGGGLFDTQSWSLLFLVGQQPAALTAFYWSSILVIVLFTLGFFTRITSILTWLIVISFTANPLVEVDTDVFLRLIAFYLMISYVLLDLTTPDLPLWVRILSPFNHGPMAVLKADPTSGKSSAVTVAMRLLQVHFAVALVMMGLFKLQLAEWWGGVTFWYPLHLPSETTIEAINDLRPKRESYLLVISLAAYLVIAWQIFFPTFAWRGGLCRWVLLGGGLAGAVGLMVIYPIPLMGPVFLLLCLTYLTDSEWFRIFSPLQRLVKG